MLIVVFGANGRVGSKVVAEAVRRGHTVRAFVFSTAEHVLQHERVEVVQGDATNAKDVASVIEGVDAVINCLGSWGTKTKDIQMRAMRVVIPAMQAADVKRIVSLTGAEARALSDGVTIRNQTSRFVFGLLAKKILLDGEDHLHQLEHSKLDWAVVRSPAMTNKGTGSGYTFTEKRPSLVATIRRDSVARAMVDLAESDVQLGNAPFLKQA